MYVKIYMDFDDIINHCQDKTAIHVLLTIKKNNKIYEFLDYLNERWEEAPYIFEIESHLKSDNDFIFKCLGILQ